MMLCPDSEPYWMQDVRIALRRLEATRAALAEAAELAGGEASDHGCAARPKDSDQPSPEDRLESTES
jgi:hypothetical protein